MKTILAACDFSTINAVKMAARIALKSKSHLHIIHVVELQIPEDSILMPRLNFEEELRKDLVSRAKTGLKRVAEEYCIGVTQITTEVMEGKVSNIIPYYAENIEAELILIGSNGSNTFITKIVGSNTDKIIRRAPCPVLTIKGDLKTNVPTIVFPNSLLDGQELLIEEVKKLQTLFNAKLLLLWINTPSNFKNDATSLKRLDEFAKTYNLSNYSLHVYNHEYIEEGILEFTNTIDAELIAMATTPNSSIGRILQGSLAEDIANRSQKYVWTYLTKKI
jgi:nucleotide-binding universal stress UspA family protein